LKVNRRFGETSPPSSGLKNILRFCLPPAFTLVSCSAYSSTMKTEAICPFESSVDIRQTTRHYIPEDSTLQI
jgi:hypothetical protein